MAMLEAHNLSKTYRLGRVDVPVLRNVHLQVKAGEWLCILGKSGSGKSTLLHLLGGLDRPDAADGSVRFNGENIASYTAGRLDRYRAERIGFVFQFYHLLPELNVLENTLVPAMIRFGRLGYASRSKSLHTHARGLLEAFGLSHRLRHRPAELSGGERQRVAIARALLNEPDVLLADEPTGNLDRSTGADILDALAGVRSQRNQTIVMVTHDEATAERADRIVHLHDGALIKEEAVSGDI